MNILRNVCGSSHSFTLHRVCGQSVEVSFPSAVDARHVRIEFGPFTPSMRLKVQSGMYGETDSSPGDVGRVLRNDEQQSGVHPTDCLAKWSYHFLGGVVGWDPWYLFLKEQRGPFTRFLLERFGASGNAWDREILRKFAHEFSRRSPARVGDMDRFLNDDRQVLLYNSSDGDNLVSLLSSLRVNTVGGVLSSNLWGLGDIRLTPEFEEFYNRTMVLD